MKEVIAKRRWSDALASKYHAAAVIAGAASAAVPAFAYDLSDFGLDTLIAGVIALALLGYVGVSAAVSLGLGAEVIYGLVIKWTKKAFGAR